MHINIATVAIEVPSYTELTVSHLPEDGPEPSPYPTNLPFVSLAKSCSCFK